MIRYMLARMEKAPSAVFFEKDLLNRFPNDFYKARQEQLLQPVRIPPDGGSYGLDLTRSYRLVSLEEGGFEAYDPEDLEEGPIQLTLTDLVRWRLDLSVVAEGFQRANGLEDKPCRLTARLFFLGQAHKDGLLMGFVLGLFHRWQVARKELLALPNILPAALDRFVVVCPSFSPNTTEQRELESLNVFVVPLGMDTPFALDYEIALRRPKPKTPRIVLSEIEEQEFEAARFQSRLPIHITGESVRRRSNLVRVAGNGVALPDALFKLFLRLVLALYESKDGFLSREGLRYGVDIDGEGALAPEGLDQALGRLREPFRAALGDRVPTQFIEVRGGKVRLSTHSRYVTLNLEGLLQHRDEVIRAMASLLKDATHGNAT